MNSLGVHSALMIIELGEAGFGIVYKTDALESKKVKIISRFSTESHNLEELDVLDENDTVTQK